MEDDYKPLQGLRVTSTTPLQASGVPTSIAVSRYDLARDTGVADS
jgi:hypothetical protein